MTPKEFMDMRWEPGSGVSGGEEDVGLAAPVEEEAGGEYLSRRYGNGTGGRNRKPCKGGRMMTVEMDTQLLGALHEIGARRGVKSVYQMIRMACYEFVAANRGRGE